MTTVFVHGVPETAVIWDDLRRRLDRDSIALSLPGFGCARPEGFNATMEEYVGWLVGELDRLDGPIDLVGHDWGGILTTRLAAMGHPKLRSWATDAVTTSDEDFIWHDFAKIWQTPTEGEAYWANIRAAPEDSAGFFVAMGVPEAYANTMISSIDDVMVASILALYRSAEDIGRQWHSTARTQARGLLIQGGEDPFGAFEKAGIVAERLGAEVRLLAGLGHWWPAQGPEAAVVALKEFWSELG